MSDLELDTVTGDIKIVNGELPLTTGKDAIAQHLAQRLRTFFGEYFLDGRIGVPYFQHILVKNPNPSVIDAIFKNVIIETAGITELKEFDLDVDSATRELTLIFRVDTVDGPIDFSEIIGVLP